MLLCTFIGVSLSSCTKDDDEVVADGLTINPAKLEMKIGENKLLEAKITPADVVDVTITWTSSNESIATVSATGSVNAIAKGEATIIATTVNSIKAVCKVTVSLIDPMAVTIEEPSSTEITVGERLQLEVNVLPANSTQTVTWESSDVSIAAVSKTGEVLAKAKGEVTIRVITCNDLEAKIKLTINPGAYKISKEMIGAWKCIKFQIINLNDGTIYEEDNMSELLKEGTDVEAWCKEVRDAVNYVTKEDNTIIWPVALTDGSTKEIEGIMTRDDDVDNQFFALYEIDEAGINFGARQADYKSIKINWLPSDNMATYQEPVVEGLDFIFFCEIGESNSTYKNITISHKKLISALK